MSRQSSGRLRRRGLATARAARVEVALSGVLAVVSAVVAVRTGISGWWFISITLGIGTVLLLAMSRVLTDEEEA